MNIPDSIKQRFKETENVTPVEQRKVRNSCWSGHVGGNSEKCSFCRQARFNTLVAGYFGDTPTITQVEDYLNKPNPTLRSTDWLFVLDYLGLPEITN